MESEHFPIKVSEDIIRVYQNGPEHSDLEHGQNHYRRLNDLWVTVNDIWVTPSLCFNNFLWLCH